MKAFYMKHLVAWPGALCVLAVVIVLTDGLSVTSGLAVVLTALWTLGNLSLRRRQPRVQ